MSDIGGATSHADLPVVEQRPVLPLGFAAGATTAGIKASGRPDLAVIAVTTAGPAAAAATFTRNLFAAAPVRLSRAHLAESGGLARAVIATSGSANAATGPTGDADQRAIAEGLATALGCAARETLAASTGLIGTRLPIAQVESATAALVREGLRADDEGLEAVADALMTTDTRRKTATAVIELPSPAGQLVSVRVSGVAKGVGMIHPEMATMIALILTDATASPASLQELLARSVAASFDCLSIDGDTSTNDTVFALASGAAGAASVGPGSPESERLGAAISAVCRSLARQQAADGEGATALITCRVAGAVDLVDARRIARSVISSNLLKAAVHGRDPNWGRVASAAGNARRPDGTGVTLRPEALRIAICGTTVYAGEPVPFDAPAVRRAMDAPEVSIDLDLGLGDAAAEAWGCDLTEAYVRENSEYST
jgi:glutamate N-acetyltransferase/amino-acid N-acetyltransferase